LNGLPFSKVPLKTAPDEACLNVASPVTPVNKGAKYTLTLTSQVKFTINSA
jgi:hypothetical protein